MVTMVTRKKMDKAKYRRGERRRRRGEERRRRKGKEKRREERRREERRREERREEEGLKFTRCYKLQSTEIWRAKYVDFIIIYYGIFTGHV